MHKGTNRLSPDYGEESLTGLQLLTSPRQATFNKLHVCLLGLQSSSSQMQKARAVLLSLCTCCLPHLSKHKSSNLAWGVALAASLNPCIAIGVLDDLEWNHLHAHRPPIRT